jgi:hypothetical protein
VRANLTGHLKSIASLEAEIQRISALEAMDKAKTAFFTSISHELKTPLTLFVRLLFYFAKAEIMPLLTSCAFIDLDFIASKAPSPIWPKTKPTLHARSSSPSLYGTPLGSPGSSIRSWTSLVSRLVVCKVSFAPSFSTRICDAYLTIDLDFLYAGHFRPIDVGHLTSDLASLFRSAIEKVRAQPFQTWGTNAS